MNTALLWLRRDLRRHDHAALVAAAADGAAVVPVFVIDPVETAGIGPARLGWLAAAYLRWHHRFIAGLAMGCLSLIVVLLTALGKWMEPDVDGFLLLCLIAIGLSVAASRWLQQQRRSHE